MLLKALLTFVMLGLLMRGARAVLSGGISRSRTPRDRPPRDPEGSPPPRGSSAPVRREDIIDVPYDEG